MVELQALIQKIKEKKELSSLDDDYVLEHIEKNLTPKIKKKLESAKDIDQFARSKEYDELRSAVRKTLRQTYGVFSHEHDNKQELLQKLVNNKDEQVVRELLNLHQSTQERLPYYTKFYRELFAITGCHPRILDIGCGLNPVSYPFMKCNARIACCDISSNDMEFLNTYFETMGIDGKAYSADALDDEKINAIVEKEKPEMILLLKVADTLETLKRHSSKKLIARLADKVQWIVVSFPLVSLGGGKRIHDNRRSWFENFLAKTEWEVENIELPNEKIYVIKTK